MDDTVSRAAVIREIMTDVRTDKTACLLHVNLICNRIEKLPPAQPEIVRCKDCVYRPCKMMPYSYDDDFCSYAKRREVSE